MRKWIDEYPEHGRTSCSDSDPCNASPDGRWCARCNAILMDRATPAGGGDAIDLIVRDVAEMPDRSSPDDWPEAMIVTPNELRRILARRLASTGSAPAPSADAARWGWLSDEHAKENSRLAVYYVGENGPESPVDYDALETVVDQFIAEDAAAPTQEPQP